jgi:hypothetical protein
MGFDDLKEESGVVGARLLVSCGCGSAGVTLFAAIIGAY